MGQYLTGVWHGNSTYTKTSQPRTLTRQIWVKDQEQAELVCTSDQTIVQRLLSVIHNVAVCSFCSICWLPKICSLALILRSSLFLVLYNEFNRLCMPTSVAESGMCNLCTIVWLDVRTNSACSWFSTQICLVKVSAGLTRPGIGRISMSYPCKRLTHFQILLFMLGWFGRCRSNEWSVWTIKCLPSR